MELSYWIRILSPKSDIISLETVVEGHPFSSIQIHFTQVLKQSQQQVVTSWNHDSIYTEMHADPY